MFDKTKSAAAAQKLLEKGQLDKALKEFERILNIDPKDLWARLKVGDIYAKLGQKESAASHYLTVAETYSKEGFNLKAIALYKQVLKFEPNNLNIYLKLADLYSQQGLLADSFSQYRFVLSQFEKQGKSLDALEIFKKMVSIDPSNFSLRFKLIGLQLKLSKINDAAIEITELSKKEVPLELTKDFVELLDKVEEISGGNADIFEASITYYLRIKEIPKIEEKLVKLIDAETKPVRSANLLMQYYKMLGFSEEAFEKIFDITGKSLSFAKVAEPFKDLLLKDFLYKEAFKITARMADDLIDKGLRNEALMILNELLPFHSVKEGVFRKLIEIAETENNTADEIKARLGLAKTYKEERKNAEFEEEINRILEKEPDSKEAKKLLAIYKEGELEEEEQAVTVEEEKREIKRGFDDFETFIDTGEEKRITKELDENAIASIDEKIAEARVYIKYGHLYKAVDILKEVCILDSMNVEALKLMIDIYKVQGNKNQEAEYVFQLIKIYDDCSMVKERDKWLSYLERFDASEGGIFSGKISQIKESLSSISEQPVYELSGEEGMDLIELDIEGLSETAETGFSSDEAGEIPEIPKTEDIETGESGSEIEELVLEEFEVPEEQAKEEAPVEKADYSGMLNEANFYYGQGFYSEAIKLYQKILQINPDEETAVKRVSELELKLKEETAVFEYIGLTEQSEGLIEQAAEEEKLFFEDDKLDLNLDEIFETIEERTEEKKEDAETLFNLGIAYKEMGMLEEAIESFKKSAKEKKWTLESDIFIGLINMEAGNPSEAAVYFLNALKIPGMTPDRVAALNYELGLAYNADLKLAEALEAFQKVYAIDKNFREVQEKLNELKKKIGQ